MTVRFQRGDKLKFLAKTDAGKTWVIEKFLALHAVCIFFNYHEEREDWARVWRPNDKIDDERDFTMVYHEDFELLEPPPRPSLGQMWGDDRWGKVTLT